MGPQLKVVERTRTATMLCAASGNPDPEITWYKDFLPIDPSASHGRIKQLRSGKRRSRSRHLCSQRQRLGSQGRFPTLAFLDVVTLIDLDFTAGPVWCSATVLRPGPAAICPPTGKWPFFALEQKITERGQMIDEVPDVSP